MKKIKILIIIATILALAGCGVTSNPSSYDSSRDGGTGITNTVNSPAEMEVGDIMAVDIDDSAEINFEGVTSSAKFILLVGNTSSSSGSSVDLSSSLIADLDKSLVSEDMENAVEPMDNEEYNLDAIFSAWMRGAEVELSASKIPSIEEIDMNKAMMPSSKAVVEGDEETFYVLNSLNSVDSYASVTAEARCIGSNIAVFVDTRVNSSILSDEEINSLCDDGDDAVGEVIDLIGEPSDKNSDGLITVLLTPQINYLGGLGGGIITGYFYAGDLYNGTGSNQQEIVYSLVPDPTGTYGTAVSKDFALNNLMRAVIPHEVQHLISYNRHVLVNDGASEESWLNEGLSHLMEDLTGYNVENPSRYSSYLANPSTTSLVASGSPNLAERGAAYLFLRFLYEQSSDGDEFINKIVNTASTGIDAVEEAFGGSNENFDEFSEFMARWTIAIAMTDKGLTRDSRYRYADRTLNTTTGNYDGVIIEGEAKDGRGTYLNGVHLTTYDGSHDLNLNSSASKYYYLGSVPDTVSLAADGGNDYAVLIRTN